MTEDVTRKCDRCGTTVLLERDGKHYALEPALRGWSTLQMLYPGPEVETPNPDLCPACTRNATRRVMPVTGESTT